MSQRYCRTSDAIDVILDLQLRYTNTGQVPLILYRNCDQLLEISRSANAADALAGKYEETANISYVPFFYLKLLKGYEAFPPQDYFVVLRPGEPYFLNNLVSFRYCVPARAHCPSLSGENYLRAVYGTWKESDEMLRRLRKLWAPFGYLWAGEVRSEPMAFTVTEQTSIPECNFPKPDPRGVFR